MRRRAGTMEARSLELLSNHTHVAENLRLTVSSPLLHVETAM